MARKTAAAGEDFNTQVHAVFERISRGEKSPHRVPPQVLADAVACAAEPDSAQRSDKSKS